MSESKNKKTILILGAGLMQKPAIEIAQKLGYSVCVADGNPSAVCVNIADRFENIDLKDKEGLTNLAQSIQSSGKLAAVFTAGTDFSASVAYVAEKCGLPGHSFEAACNASDKSLMRGCFKKAYVNSPHYVRADDDSTGLIFLSAERLGELLYPLVVKPVDNMGGRGCRLVKSFDDLKEAVTDAKKNSRTGCAIVEDYMEGSEFSIDALVHNGELTICGFADRHIFFPPFFIEMGHTMPTALNNETIYSLCAEFARGVKALGLTEGAAKADIKLTRKGPMIGEIAARLSGGYMSGWTFPYASDFNLTEQAILLSAGEQMENLEQKRIPLEPITDVNKLDVEKRPLPFKLFIIPVAKTSAERAWISIPGKIITTNKGITGLEEATACRYVKQVLPRVKPGDNVTFPHNNVEKCGNIITLGPTREEAVSAAEKAVSCITIRLEANNPETELFLEQSCRNSFPPSAFQLSDETLNDISRLFPEYSDSCNSESENKLEKSSAFDTNGKIIIPDCLKSIINKTFDWNHKSLSQVLEDFSKEYRNPPEIDAERFWHDCIRGSIQGILYRADFYKSREH